MVKAMGKTKHMLKEDSKAMLEEFEHEIERRWNQLKAKHESPFL